MTITYEQVADLREGDLVELTNDRWPGGTAIRGRLWAPSSGVLSVAGQVVRFLSDAPVPDYGFHLQVIERAPRPAFTNAARSEPVVGDAILDGNGRLWVCGSLSYPRVRLTWWSNPTEGTGGPYWKDDPIKPWRLVFDGEQRLVVA